MMDKRETGFYWVKVYSDYWETAFYIQEYDCWRIAGMEGLIDAEDVRQIGPRIYPPEEQEAE